MTKEPIYLKTDLTYFVVTWNLSMMPSIVHLKERSAKGRFAFTVGDDPVFNDVLIQVTSKGKLNIYIPENAPKDEIIEKTLKIISEANQTPIKILSRKKAIPHKQEQHSIPQVDIVITQGIVGDPHAKRQLPSVGCNIFNPNNYPIRVKVEARTIFGGRNLGLIKDKYEWYSGGTEINLNPSEGIINGNFTIPKECVDSTEEISIEIRAIIIDQDEREYNRLPVGWTYMRKENTWFYEPRTFTNGT